MPGELSGKAAIVGVGATDFSKNSGRSELRLAAEAVLDLTMPARVVIFIRPEVTADDAAAPNDQVQVSMVQPTAPPITDAGSLVTAGSLAAPAP